MLVDTDSSADILYLSTYEKLGLNRNMLQPMHTLLTGFIGHSVSGHPDSSYNGLIGQPILTALRAIVSPLHLKSKFPTAEGIGEISANQKKVECGIKHRFLPWERNRRKRRSAIEKIILR
ncbi:hypothetical protein LIER_01894 [Lithospermum erythrorhizon]|uniref:Uncharacterized protein n=1 Tax=Lithospermum erythrorhizon TaxID=34254 RepID=A0AAV3NNT3_LITER